ncbi:MAG: sigma-70 family RNA polymerase sigma factor, partial [Bacteroidales bacterium]|nr:sigma-70 family RNA polymerase sigma factor [Bacteroidales bacterium]
GKEKQATEAINKWVEEYTGQMYSWAYFKTSDSETADDIVQDTFLAAFQAYHKFEGKSSPKTWLFRILNNKIADYHRKNFKNPSIPESSLKTEDDRSFFDRFFDDHGGWKKEAMPSQWSDEDEHILDDPDFRKILQICLELLPPNWFSAVHLKYLAQMDGKDICQDLGITPTNFWQILHRAKLQLRKCLDTRWHNT